MSGYCRSHDIMGDASVEVQLSFSVGNTLSITADPEAAEDSGNWNHNRKAYPGDGSFFSPSQVFTHPLGS